MSDGTPGDYERELRQHRRMGDPLIPEGRGRVKWEPWQEVVSKQPARMSDGKIVPPGEPFMTRHRRIGDYVTATEMYDVPSWVARKLDNDAFMGEWYDG